jgi:hypothetical protein
MDRERNTYRIVKYTIGTAIKNRTKREIEAFCNRD